MLVAQRAIELVAVAAMVAYASPVQLDERAAPTLYLAGDSTMAKSSDGVIDGASLAILKFIMFARIS
jgi:hypothetical protein